MHAMKAITASKHRQYGWIELGMAISFLVLLTRLAPAQQMKGEIIAITHKDYDPLKGGEGPPLSTLGPVSLDRRGIVQSTKARSWWVNITGNVQTYSYYKSTVKGSFKEVTFSVYRDTARYRYNTRRGTGILKNKTGDIIAEGKLHTTEDWLAISGKKGATFKFEAHENPVKAVWTDAAPAEFAILTLTKTHEWTIENKGLSFLMEVNRLSWPTLMVLLPESIARASIITVPKGALDLFGHKIVASRDGAKVKFQHGAVVECSGCTALSISKVERRQRWEGPGPLPGTVSYVEAKEGEEILVVHLRVKSEGPITVNGFGIIDETGKKNEQCETNIMGWEGDVPPDGIMIPFTIPKSLRVKKLAVRNPAMEINIPEQRPEDREQKPKKETYEKVVRAELPFAFESKAKGISFDGESYTVTGGTVTEFSLAGKNIPLQTDEITEDGYVLTKDFGKVKLTFSSTMKVTIWLTPSQKKAFKQFATSHAKKK